MANVIITPNMSLPNPVPSVDPGPDYANNLSSSFNILDGHNHTPGSGVQIPVSALNINGDLPISGNNVVGARSIRFSVQPTALSGVDDLGCLYVTGVDLWYNDENGTQIQLTSGGVVNATSSGISSGAASASFVASVLVVNAAANTPANIKGGSVLLGNNVANSKYLTLSPPTAMGSNYSLTLPPIPGAQSFMSMDTSGNMAGYAAVAGGITAANIETNVSLLGKSVQESGKNVIVSNTNASTNSLSVIRGTILGSNGSTVFGEGFSCARNSTGSYAITWTTDFLSSDAAVVVASVRHATAVTLPGTATAIALVHGVQIGTYNASGSPADLDFNFIAIAQRS